MNIRNISHKRQQEYRCEEDNFDKVCKTISEDQWQQNRKKLKREQRIAALLIAVPMVLVVCSALAGIRMWLIH